MKFITKIAAILTAAASLISTSLPLFAAGGNDGNAAVIPFDPAYSSELIIAVNDSDNEYSSSPAGTITASHPSFAYYNGEYDDLCGLEAEYEPSLSEPSGEADERTFYTSGTTTEYCQYGIYKVTAVKLYDGIYCTVWCQTVCDPSIKMNASDAAQIGTEFDRLYPLVTGEFGNYIYDPDGDGKVALLCYDIADEKTNGINGTYTTGTFVHSDLANKNGAINSISYGQPPACVNTSDMLHIDTFPSMGGSLNKIEKIYSTLAHELTHLIAFSYTIKDSAFKNYDPMPSYLGEGFAMEAERAVYGDAEIAGRVSSFISAGSCVNGASLTVFDFTMAAYGRAYVFAQYLRTRMAAMGGFATDGTELFTQAISSRSRNDYDTLKIIADILGTDKKSLFRDFWCAAFLNEASGPHGFNGEAFASQLSLTPLTLTDGTVSIGNGGGAVFIADSGISLDTNNKISLYTISYDIPSIASVSLVRTSDNGANAIIEVSAFTGSAALYVGGEYVGEVGSGTNTLPISVSDIDGSYSFSLLYGGIENETVSAFLTGIPKEPTLILSNFIARRYSFYGVQLKFNANEGGRIYYTVSYGAIKNKTSIKTYTTVKEGSNNIIGSASLMMSVLSYYYVDAQGNESPIFTARI